MIGSFAAAYLLEWNVILILLICGLLGAGRALYGERKGREKE